MQSLDRRQRVQKLVNEMSKIHKELCFTLVTLSGAGRQLGSEDQLRIAALVTACAAYLAREARVENGQAEHDVAVATASPCAILMLSGDLYLLPKDGLAFLEVATQQLNLILSKVSSDYETNDVIAEAISLLLLKLVDSMIRLTTQVIAIRSALSDRSFASAFRDKRRELMIIRRSVTGFESIRAILETIPILTLPSKLVSRILGSDMVATRIETNPLNPFLQYLLALKLIQSAGLANLSRSIRVATGHGYSVVVGQGIRKLIQALDGPQIHPAIVCLDRAIALSARRLFLESSNDAALLVMAASLQKIGELSEALVASDMFERALRAYLILLKRTNKINIAADACLGIAAIYKQAENLALATAYERLGENMRMKTRQKFGVKQNISLFEVGFSKLSVDRWG